MDSVVVVGFERGSWTAISLRAVRLATKQSAYPFPNYVVVGFQFNWMQLKTSVLYGMTAFPTSTTHLFSITTFKDRQMTAETNGLSKF